MHTVPRMANLLTKPLSNEQIQQQLDLHAIPVNVEVFIETCGEPEEIIRTRSALSRILCTYDRENLSHDAIDKLFRKNRIQVTMKEYLNDCSKYNHPESEATQRFFVLNYIEKMTHAKRSSEKPTVLGKKTELL